MRRSIGKFIIIAKIWRKNKNVDILILMKTFPSFEVGAAASTGCGKKVIPYRILQIFKQPFRIF